MEKALASFQQMVLEQLDSHMHTGFPRWLSGTESAHSARDSGFNPGSGRSPGGGHGNTLQYSCLENLTDRGAWWATVHGIAQSPTGRMD